VGKAHPGAATPSPPRPRARAGDRLRVVIDRSYPLAEIVAAHRYVDGGHKVGNVVVTVADE